MRLNIPYELAKSLTERHGGTMYVCSKPDWDRIKKVLKKYPKVYKKLKELDIIMTPLIIRDHSGKVVKSQMGRIIE